MLSSELENSQMVALNTFETWFTKELQDEGDDLRTTRATWRGKFFGRDMTASIDYIIAEARIFLFDFYASFGVCGAGLTDGPHDASRNLRVRLRPGGAHANAAQKIHRVDTAQLG